MAKNQEIDLSTTAASNADFGGVNVDEGMAPSDVNNAMRYLAKMRADAITRHVAKGAGSYTALKTDHNQFWRCTGAVTVNLTAAATLTSGWCLWVRANGGAVTIDPNGAEEIDGSSSSKVIADGQSILIICTGTAFFTAMQGAAGDDLVTLTGTQTLTNKTLTSPTINGGASKWFSGLLHGLTLANNGGDATNDIDVAAGVAASDDATPMLMDLASGLTKRLDAGWAVGTNQGGLDTGSIANTTYHVWLIRRSDTGVVDALFSTSATAPTMPANYDQKRRIGSIIRSGGAILAFAQNGDLFELSVPVTDISTANPGTSAVTAALTVPIGIKVRTKLSSSLRDTSAAASGAVLITDLAQANTVPSTAGPFTYVKLSASGSGNSEQSVSDVQVMTNTSGQIRYRLGESTVDHTFYIITHGWYDMRGRDG